MSVVGVKSKTKAPPFVPDLAEVGTTQALIQGIAHKEDGAEVGLLLNFDVAHGGSHVGGSDQKVGFADFVRAHPGPGGAKPGDIWAFNPDIQVAAGSGNLLAINTEADFNNFNDCGGPGCFMVMLWHNYLSSHPITADTYLSGDSNKNVGTATIAGTTLTRIGGVPFTRDTTTIEVDGRLVRVDAYVGPSALTLAENLGTRPRASTTWRSHLVHTALLISGDNAVADQDVLSSSSGYYGVFFNGHHNVLLAAAADSAPYAMVARPGQAVCFDGVDGCLLHVGGDRLQYQVEGNPAVQFVGVPASGGANFAVIRNAARDAGPSVTVDGAAPAAPLNLSGKGGRAGGDRRLAAEAPGLYHRRAPAVPRRRDRRRSLCRRHVGAWRSDLAWRGVGRGYYTGPLGGGLQRSELAVRVNLEHFPFTPVHTLRL